MFVSRYAVSFKGEKLYDVIYYKAKIFKYL